MKIPAPIMFDSNKKVSKNIDVELSTSGNNTIITLIPDSEWLSDESRAYPIVIDPPVEIAIDADKIIDVTVDSSSPTINCEGGEYLQTGNYAGAIFRTYSKVTIPTLTSADMVTDATFDLSLYTDHTAESPLDVHKVTSNWQPETITWNNQPTYNPKIEDYEVVSGYTGDPFMWDITGVVKDWYATGNNYGLLFKSNNESITSGAAYNEFYAAECFEWTTDYTPYMVINYVNFSGIEDYYSYHSQSVGRAGNVYTNDYNGNVVLVHNDIAMTGNRMPIALNHVFNSNTKNIDSGYGNGWNLNASQKITPVVIDGTNYFEYTDEDGTKHYFNGATNTWDESGINLKLTKNVDGTYLLIDKTDNKINFKADGVINSVVDRNGNTLTYIYGTNGSKPEQIKDPSGRIVKLNYTNGKLSTIVDPANRTVATFVYTGNLLTSINYIDGKTSSYTYDANGNLKTITNYDGYRLSYDYYTGISTKVKQVIETHTNGTTGDRLDSNIPMTTAVSLRRRKT